MRTFKRLKLTLKVIEDCHSLVSDEWILNAVVIFVYMAIFTLQAAHIVTVAMGWTLNAGFELSALADFRLFKFLPVHQRVVFETVKVLMLELADYILAKIAWAV